ALGLQDKADADLAAFEAALQSAREAVGNAANASVVAIYPGNSVAVFTDHPRTTPWLLRQMGVTLHPDGSEDGLGTRDGCAFASLDGLDRHSGDERTLLHSDHVDGETEAVTEISGNALWMQIPAGQSGNVTVLDRLGYPAFRGVNALLQDLVDIFR